MTDELRKQAEEACPYGYEAAAGWKRQIWVLGFHAGCTARAEKDDKCPHYKGRYDGLVMCNVDWSAKPELSDLFVPPPEPKKEEHDEKPS